MRKYMATGLFLLMTAVMALAIGYVARRTAWALNVSPIGFYIGYGSAFLFAFVLTFMARLPFAVNPVWHIATVVAGYLLGLLFCILLAFLLVDAVQWLAHFTPHTWGLSALCTTLLLAIVCMGLWMRPHIHTIQIPISGLTQSTRIVHLTDLHLGHMRGKHNLQTIVRKTNAVQPDFVVITGDLYDAYYNLSLDVLRPLQEIKAPVYFVEGNHDIYVNSPRIKQMLRELGIRVLENEVVLEHGIQLIGLDYMQADNETPDNMHVPVRKETIKSTLATLPLDSTKPIIALHHNPIGADYFAQAGVDLYLAGHTHGGQFYPLIWINDRGFEYNRGLYQHDNMHIYVSPGTGATAIPLRMGKERAEITVLELTASHDSEQ